MYDAILNLDTATLQIETCGAIHLVLQDLVGELSDYPRPNSPRAGPDPSSDDFSSAAAQERRVLPVVAALCCVIHIFVSVESNVAPESLFHSVCMLHDLIFHLSHMPTLQHDLAKLCVLWYRQDRPGKELLIPQTIYWVISKCLETHSKIADIKMLLSCQEMLNSIDFQDPSSTQLRILLQRCMKHALFVSSTEGKKFLCFVFTSLSPNLVVVMHKTIKNELLQCPKSKARAYAEVYYQAWKNATGENLLRIEQAIQDCIHISIHAKSSSVISAIKTILNHISSQKMANPQVEAMLERLYMPVLWRSFQAANPHVRENAMMQLALAFPIAPSNSTQSKFDDLLQEQLNFLVESLRDPYHFVRRQTVLTIGRILSLYWEILQTQITSTLLNALVFESAFDQASPLVREAVFKALQAILQNPMSHSSLRQHISTFVPHLFDTSTKVRMAFVRLLHAMSKIKKVKYYQFIDAKHVLDAFVSEKTPKVKALLAEILISIYWPWENCSVTQLVVRCLALLNEHRAAARELYAYIDLDPKKTKMPLAVPVEFMCKLIKVLKVWLEIQERSPNTDLEKTPNEKRIKLSASLDAERAATLVEILSSIWRSAASSPEGANLIARAYQLLNDDFLILLSSHVEQTTTVALIRQLDPRVVPKTVEYMTEQVASLSDGSWSLTNAIECLFSWGGEIYRRQSINFLVEGLKLGLRSDEPKSTKGSKKQQSLSARSQSERALNALSELIDRSKQIREYLLNFPEVYQTLIETLEKYHQLAEKLLCLCFDEEMTIDGSHVQLAFSIYYRLIIHFSVEKDRTHAASFPNLLDWIEKNCLSRLAAVTREDELDLPIERVAPSHLAFPLRLLENLLVILNDLVILGLSDHALNQRLLRLCINALRIRSDQSFLRICTLFFWKLCLHHQRNCTHMAISVSGGELELGPMVILSILRSHPETQNTSVAALKLWMVRAAKENQSVVVPPLRTILFSYFFDTANAQFQQTDYEAKMALFEEPPVDVQIIAMVFGSSHVTLSEFLTCVNDTLRQSCYSKDTVWVIAHMMALVLSRSKSTGRVLVTKLKKALNKAVDNMQEDDSNKAGLRSNAIQLLEQALNKESV